MSQYWQPNQGAATPPPPIYKCRVCGGKGYTFFEAGNGLPTQRRTCTYCKGSGNDQWVHANHAKAARKFSQRSTWWRIGGIVYVLAIWTTGSLSFWNVNDPGNTSPWILVHYLAWAVAVFAVCRLVITTPAWKRWKAQRAAKAGDGFTSTEERVLGTAFVVGSTLKFQHDQRQRQNQQFQNNVNDWMQRHQ